LVSHDILTEIFAEGIQDKIFCSETQIIATLEHALGDKICLVRKDTVDFFTAAIAQGMLHWFPRIFIPNIL